MKQQNSISPGTAPLSRQTLSVAIVAKDEEANLLRVLPTVSWADEIVLVDSGSTDRTVSVAGEHGARVVHLPWPGYGAQVNNAVRACKSDWVLSLDADEQLTAALGEEIRTLLASAPPFKAYWIPRRNYFLGRPLQHGGFYPDRKLRLFQKGVAWAPEDTEPHATPKYNGPSGRLYAAILHDAYPTLLLYIEHMNRYSTASLPLVRARGKLSASLPAFLWNVLVNPIATFLYNYVVRAGFLDGREGLLLHLYHSCYVSWKYAKAWETSRERRSISL